MSNIKKILVSVLVASFAFVALAQNASAQTYSWTRTLKQGSRGADVANLQRFLNVCTNTQVASAGRVGSAGRETTYFGPSTRAAVIAFQATRGITPASGVFGPISRGVAMQLQASGSPCTGGQVVTPPSNNIPGCNPGYTYSITTGQPCNGTPTQTSGPVSASLAVTNPGANTVVAGQATADLAHFQFSGTGTVTAVELQRIGISADTSLTSVYLYEGNTRLTDAASVTSGGVIRFSSPTGLFTVNGSRTISVRADIKSDANGQTVGVRLNNYTVAGQTAATASTLMGNVMSVASNSGLATVTINSNAVATPTIDAGTSNYTVWNATVNVAGRAVWLKAANFKVIGSAQADALQNARLIVDGAQVGASTMVNSLGNLSFDLSSAPVSLITGSHTIEVRADVVGGASRTFYVSLQNAGDLMFTDSQFANVNITLTNSGTGNTAGAFSMNNSGTITIGSGTLSVSKDPAFTTTTITSGASNVVLGRYTLRAYGEAVKVMQVVVDVDLSTGTTGLQNITLFANGAQVGTSQNAAGFTTWTSGDDANTDLTFNLGSALIVPAGQTMNLEIRGDLQNAAGVAYAGTVTTDITIPVSQAQGQSSYTLYPSGSALTTPTTSVTSATTTATVAKSAGVTNQNVANNTSGVKIGSFVIQAGTTEGLRVTNLAIAIAQVVGTATTGDIELTDISNLRLTVNGTQLAGVSPQASNNFSVDMLIPSGATHTVDVYADINNATAGETITTTLTATARGATSNQTVSTSATTGQTMTVGTATLGAPTIVGTSLTNAHYVLGGTSNEPIIRYRFTATNGNVALTELRFTVGGTAGAVTAITVTGSNGGTCSAPVVGTTATLTGCNFTVPQGFGGMDLIVTPTYNTVGYGSISAGSTATVDLTDVNSTPSGGSPSGLTAVTLAVSNTMTLVSTLPTLTLSPSNAVLTNGLIKVGSVTIAAGSTGSINLESLGITLTASGGALMATSAGVDVTLKEGNTTITTTDDVPVGTGTAASFAATVTFSNDENVVAGGSRTFDIYVTASAVTGGDDSITVTLAPVAGFVWDDINGNGDNLTGTLIMNYPTSASVTIND